MNINEKQRKLEEARKILKSEFIGIDKIIDQLIQSVTPWYVTPEILERPLVISLWGITGTGKTSIVKRLFEILEISRVVTFDSGEIVDKTMFGEMVVELLSLDESYSSASCSDTVFVFDEFQHARTIDERGNEITKPSIRQMWNLIDSGTLVVREFNYNAMKLTVFLEDLGGLVASCPGIPVSNLEIIDPECVKTVLSSIGLIWYEDRAKAIYSDNVNGDNDYWLHEADEDEEEGQKKDKDPFRPLKAIPSQILRAYFTVLNRTDKSIGIKERYDSLMKCTTLDEIYDTILQIKDALAGQKRFDFSKSIIFLIGNLDEAFCGANNVDPDQNADIFKRRIDDITISKIKTALGRRFRAEQIARFGNTILKYPAFTSQDFNKLINFELGKVLGRFKNQTGREITYTKDVVDLIYSEGVFPAQGTRPVFTTIAGLFTPLLSSALIDFPEDNKIEVSVVNPELGYRVNKKSLKFISNSGKEKEYEINLTLGSNRNPENNPLRYAIGVHEAGHAVVTSYLTGDLPIEIVSTSASGGGHTTFTRLAEPVNDQTVNLLELDIKGLLGGLLAEEMLFKCDIPGKEKKYITLGSSLDLSSAFEKFTHAVYKCGYYEEKKLARTSLTTRGDDGLPAGFDDFGMDQVMRSDLKSS